MFGFLRGPRSTAYRQVYARCCSAQRSLFGLRSLPLVSFEGVFLYALAVDLRLIAPPRPTDPRCCRARGSGRLEATRGEADAATMAAHAAMLLAATKLDDDVRDSGSWMAHGLRCLLRLQINNMHRFLDRCDPSFRPAIARHIAAHHQLERPGSFHPIERYSATTAAAFSDLFRLYYDQCRPDAHAPTGGRDLFGHVGHCVGSALIAFDCAVDWPRDRRRGQYNPLRRQQQVAGALAFSIAKLTEAGWRIGDATGGASITSAVLKHRIATLIRRRNGIMAANLDARCQPRRRRWLARAGAIDLDCFCDLCDCCDCSPCCDVCVDAKKQNKPPRAARKKRKRPVIGRRARDGFCDCDCDCDGCDLGDCFGFRCMSPCDVCCADACDTSSKQQDPQQVKAKESADDLIGLAGIATTLLAPYGTVMIQGREHSAKSEFGVIEEGQPVMVAGKGSFGLVVRPAQSEAHDSSARPK